MDQALSSGGDGVAQAVTQRLQGGFGVDTGLDDIAQLVKLLAFLFGQSLSDSSSRFRSIKILPVAHRILEQR